MNLQHQSLPVRMCHDAQCNAIVAWFMMTSSQLQSELRLQELSGMKDAAAKSEELVQSSPVAERNSVFL